jgi:hypothetical protein
MTLRHSTYNAISLSTPPRFMGIAIGEQKARWLLRSTRTQRRKTHVAVTRL